MQTDQNLYFKMTRPSGRLRIRKFFYIFVIALMPTSLFAETIRYADMDEETEKYLERGLSWPDLACFKTALAEMLWKAQVPPENIYITFDDPSEEGISLSTAESGYTLSCVSGVLTDWDAGDATIIHDFN